MNESVYFLVLLFLGIWEVWMAYALMEEIFSLKNLKTKKYTFTKWGNIFCAGDVGSDQSIDCVFIKNSCYSLYFSNLYLHKPVCQRKKGVWRLGLLHFTMSFLQY